ncbi:MAG: transporter substrate-binding domain-containing protein [Victivallales bacterium]|nr:transporter substrate-binding domain-containing protein [Victivallales bacterium]
MKKIKIIFILIAFLLCIIAFAGKDYKIVTEDYPPFNYVENGKLKGISTEIIKLILKEINWSDTDIQVLPWDIALELSKHTPNTIIFSMVRTPKREKNFKWVGPIATDYWNIYSMSKIGTKEMNYDLNTLEDAKKYSIATQHKGAFTEHLVNKKFAHLQLTKNLYDSVKEMLNYKAQLIAASELPFYCVLSKEKIDQELIQCVLKVKTIDMYIGFNKNIPDSVVHKFEQALNKLKQSGKYDKITNKYYEKFLGNN